MINANEAYKKTLEGRNIADILDEVQEYIDEAIKHQEFKTVIPKEVLNDKSSTVIDCLKALGYDIKVNYGDYKISWYKGE